MFVSGVTEQNDITEHRVNLRFLVLIREIREGGEFDNLDQICPKRTFLVENEKTQQFY